MYIVVEVEDTLSDTARELYAGPVLVVGKDFNYVKGTAVELRMFLEEEEEAFEAMQIANDVDSVK